MISSLCLAAIVGLAPSPDLAPAADPIEAIADDGVLLVGRLDLTRLDLLRTAKSLVGEAAIAPPVEATVAAADRWIASLKAAGVQQVNVLVDLADMPGYPVLAIPLAGADTKALGKLLLGGAPGVPLRWPVTAIDRGFFFAGSPAALARIGANTTPRPGVGEALAAGGDAPIRLAIVPGRPALRLIEETLPTLPDSLGGGPIEPITRGMRWAAIGLAIDPKPVVRAVVRGTDPEATIALAKVGRSVVAGVIDAARKENPAIAPLADALAAIPARIDGSEIRVEADLGPAVALITVPVEQARQEAGRSVSVNNLKQIGLALHNYHSTFDSFPPAYTTSKEGKPLLSWRVLILPYLEAKPLYDQFHLDEPWDGPHNKPLLDRMPETFRSGGPSSLAAITGQTSMLAPSGPGTMFPGAKAIRLNDVTDGTSNSIMVVETNAGTTVPWTAPEDWTALPEPKFDALRGRYSTGTFVVLFGDGSVRSLPKGLSVELLKKILSISGGEVVSADDL